MPVWLERELKLDPPPGFELPPLEGSPLESRLFTSTYHDTPGLSLARAGITLRRRMENGKSRWQLKLPRDEGARAEIDVAGGPAGPPARLRGLLLTHLRHGALAPVATLRTRRTGILATKGEQPVAEVTVDTVSILEGAHSVGGFTELEIELVGGGGKGDLKRLHSELVEAGAEPSDGRPKVFRALGLAVAPGTGKSLSRRSALALEAQLRELEAHDPGVRLGDDPEDVHKMRVATRRARALVRATPPLHDDALAPLADELKWLAGVLGEVRDLDVLLEHLTALAADLGTDREAAESLVATLAGERTGKRTALLEALDSERYFALLDALAVAFAELLEDVDGGDSKVPAADELRRLRKAARRLAREPEDDELHALRVRAKRARYAAELVGGRRAAVYIEALKHLQDVIGDHQDAVVAEQRLRKIARATTAVAAGRLIERERARRSEARAAYPEAIAAVLDRGRAALA